MNSQHQTVLLIPLGDPYSVNIECIWPLILRCQKLKRLPVCLIGSEAVFLEQLNSLSMEGGNIIPYENQTTPGLYFLNIPWQVSTARAQDMGPKERGHIARLSLEACLAFEERFSKLILLTCPVDKSNLNLAGFAYPGQTEFFGEIWGGTPLMALLGERLKVGLVTNHLPLSQVPRALTRELIYKKTKIFWEFLRHHSDKPIGVAALNPHCGEGGLFGTEEASIIAPAIGELRKEGIPVEGPSSGDTVFYRAYNGELAGVMAMYHDQGLAPLKTVHFDTAINATLGLKHLRFSPDHGPAKDLFLQEKASSRSFEACLDGIRVP
jgi:4-hydroxythreonine-4-phosphate dehydrogenase